jgi:putative glycosyltransferase (TIGR04372 family)
LPLPADSPDSIDPHSWYYRQAQAALRNADAELALHHLNQCRKIVKREWFVPFTMAQIQMQLVGDVHEAIRMFKYARRMRECIYTPTSGKPPLRFLNVFWGDQIGHTANIEHLIKREILLKRDPKNLIFLSPATPANQALLDKMGAYITVAKSETDLPLPQEVLLSVLEDYYICESLDGLTKHWWHASAEIFRAWEKAGRKPLLTLTGEERGRGRATLRDAGIPYDAWFATLHIRESGFKSVQGFTKVEQGLNADIATYLPAIKAVVERGGVVIRIGDPSMSPLPPMPGLFDYARSPLKSDWMDVFLLGGCRLFIGTSSGPADVPPLFGVPCALTNWFPTGSRPFNDRDIYIPKLIQIGNPPRILRFDDMVSPPIGYAVHYERAKEINLSAVPNTPDEIRDVVIELLDRLDGEISYSDEDHWLQQTFEAVAESNFCYGNARMGRDFLRRHKELLICEASCPTPPSLGRSHAPIAPATMVTSAATVAETSKANPFISDDLPAGLAELSARYKERRITNFLVGQKIIDRQNAAIAQCACSFFFKTESLKGASLKQVVSQISKFREIYLNAPITMNNGGVHFSTGLFLYLIACRRDPTVIVESGVYKGLSTYFLSAACPRSVLHAFDPDLLKELAFRCANATYHATDWMNYDIRCEPLGSSLAFFDDHQCHAKRVIEAHGRGFRHLIFDDSWPIEAVIGCGWPPIPSVDMVMNDALEANETVQWMEDGRIWTYVHDRKMQQLCATARALISAVYDVPSLYRESGIGPTSAMKYVELVP